MYTNIHTLEEFGKQRIHSTAHCAGENAPCKPVESCALAAIARFLSLYGAKPVPSLCSLISSLLGKSYGWKDCQSGKHSAFPASPAQVRCRHVAAAPVARQA